MPTLPISGSLGGRSYRGVQTQYAVGTYVIGWPECLFDRRKLEEMTGAAHALSNKGSNPNI